MEVHEQLLRTTARCLARYEAYTGAGPLLAAVSGGPDSTVLAWVLAELRRQRRLAAEVIVAHVEHGVHPTNPEARAEVERTCARLDLPLRCTTLEGVGDDEAALRTARYAALVATAADCGARLVLTAHHADDDLETVLLRMIRGTGPRGLAGIPEFRPIAAATAVVRPFLRTRRASLLRVLAGAGLTAFTDPTNSDPRYARNHLRLEILPQLRATMGPGLDLSLIALARSARATTAVLEAHAARLVRERASFPAPWRGELLTPGAAAGDADEAPFLEEVIAQVHARVHGAGARPGWPVIGRILALLAADDGHRVCGPRALLVERTRGGLLFVDPGRQGAAPQTGVLVDATAECGVRFGTTEWVVLVRPHAEPPIEPSPRAAGPRRALIDLAGVPLPLRLRARRSTDRFWPLGAPGPTSLRRFLKSRHVPRFDRDRLPLLVGADDRILWVAGVEIAAPHRITTSTARCLEARLGILGGVGPQRPSY